MADRTPNDLAAKLERSQNAYTTMMSDGHNSIIVRSKDDELAECYRLMAEAARLLREQAEQLDTLRNAESVGVSYCTLHHGIANEDDRRCDFADNPRPCVLVELIQRPRPALAAAGGAVPEEGATDEQ